MNRQWILSSIDLKIETGEQISLIGPNGAGKSSLCRMILGLIQPTNGKIWRKKGLRFSYVPTYFSSNQLLPLNIFDFMKLGDQKYLSKDIHFWLEKLDLEEKSQHMLWSLSSGERQRLMMAKALMRKPDLLVLDEALSHISFSGQKDIIALINETQKEQGFASIYVSHDMFWVMAQTHRVICINRHISCMGQPEDISAHPEVQELLGGHYTYYRHQHDNGCGKEKQR